MADPFEAKQDFGPATRLQAQAIGQPGQRVFRLLVEARNNRSAALRLEKEQLQALGLAVEQMLAELQGRLASAAPRRPSTLEAPETFPLNPSVEFQVGRLALGQDESELENGPRYVLLAYDIEGTTEAEGNEPTGPAAFACRATREQLRVLSRDIADVVAAGRPRCPLCGEAVQTLEQPHGCVRTNGHHT